MYANSLATRDFTCGTSHVSASRNASSNERRARLRFLRALNSRPDSPDLRCAHQRHHRPRDLGTVPAYAVLSDSSLAEYLWDVLVDAMIEFGGRPVGVASLRQLTSA